VPFTSGNDPLAGTLRPNALGRSGDDFYALRPYVVGDDLRRIHWPSTARHDELLVRQQEQPWQGRTTVLLDVRRATHDLDSFEAAVSAAASIVTANGGRHDLVRMLTTDGVDSGYGSGTSHVQALLEHLAVVQLSGGASLRAVLDLLRRDGQGALVVLVSETTGDDLAATSRLRQRFGLITVVQMDQGRPVRVPGGSEPAMTSSAALVRVTPGTSFPTVWDRAVVTATKTGQRAGMAP